jgi:hypothetical protein
MHCLSTFTRKNTFDINRMKKRIPFDFSRNVAGSKRARNSEKNSVFFSTSSAQSVARKPVSLSPIRSTAVRSHASLATCQSNVTRTVVTRTVPDALNTLLVLV